MEKMLIEYLSEKLINNYFFFAYLLFLNFLNEPITFIIKRNNKNLNYAFMLN